MIGMKARRARSSIQREGFNSLKNYRRSKRRIGEGGRRGRERGGGERGGEGGDGGVGEGEEKRGGEEGEGGGIGDGGEERGE